MGGSTEQLVRQLGQRGSRLPRFAALALMARCTLREIERRSTARNNRLREVGTAVARVAAGLPLDSDEVVSIASEASSEHPTLALALSDATRVHQGDAGAPREVVTVVESAARKAWIEVRRDVELLETLSEQAKWDDDTRVSQVVFGPLWPNDGDEVRPPDEPAEGGASFLLRITGRRGAASGEVRELAVELLAALDRLHRSSGDTGIRLLDDAGVMDFIEAPSPEPEPVGGPL